jgi:ribosome-associated toxin RatA of RatAB toxin-antitoxin module
LSPLPACAILQRFEVSVPDRAALPTCEPEPRGVPAELFAPPSHEHRWLVAHMPWLVAPADGRGRLVARFLRMVMVAPMTQMTFVSFDLQVFLYSVFHTTAAARVGHFVFQAAVTFWLLVAACALGPAPAGPTWLAANGAAGLAVVLLACYAAMARPYRLWAWWALMVPVVGALLLGANRLYSHAFDPAVYSLWQPLPLPYNPWLWMLGSAFVVAMSHAPEPKLPPRTVEGLRWLSMPEYLFGRPDLPSPRPLRWLRVGLFPLWGTLDELWASPRLVPYGFLLLLFRFGYRRDLWDQQRTWVERAWQSGNPALDYVGVGGGTGLRLGTVATALVLCALPMTAAALEERDISVVGKAMPGTSIPQWTVQAVVHAPPADVWKVVDDCGNYKRSMPRIAKSRELSRTATKVMCESTVKMPIPFSNLESVSEATLALQPGRWERQFRHVSGDFKKNDGSWLLTPAGPDGQWTQFVYVLHSLPDVNLPDAFVRRGQAAAMIELIQNVARLAPER